jgi:PHD/YefM family antitoxin component YafN of YafNO toxin-antitoxin module
MTTIDLSQQQPSVNELLRLAADDPVRIRNQEGEEFILEPADAFEREVAELSRSEAFRAFLAERSGEPGRKRLEDIERRLVQAEQEAAEGD